LINSVSDKKFDMKKAIILLFLLLTAGRTALAQSVGIGTNTPAASAQLDITSTTKGILIPRMTEAEKNAIAGSAQGLMVFNTTTNSFQYNNGSLWLNLSHSGIISGVANKVPRFNSPWGLSPGLITDNVAAVSINTNNAVADGSALLDITSTTKGILIPRMTSAQRNAIASPAPGLLLYDTDLSAFWFYDGNVWAGLGDTSGGGWTASGTNIYNSNTGNVGIGTSTPQRKLDIAGGLHTTGDSYMEGWLSVGGSNVPAYKLQVNDGSVAIYNSTDLKYWAMNYSSSGNVFSIQESLTSRLSILNGGNVGIGTNTPDYKLDVAGAIRASGNIQSQSNLSVTGSATVNGGGGVAYNPNSGTNLKIVPFTTAPFYAVLGPHASAETSITLPSGFTTTPRVFVGSIYLTGGSAGELNRVILQLWNCDNNSCTAKIINTDNSSVNYSIQWNCLAIGN
jgi:hypothetical protein